MDATLATLSEAKLLERLRERDEHAFELLVDRYYATMAAVARSYVKTPQMAEEVVQEAWLGILKGIERFEGRSSLKTWIISIVANIARTKATRESRTVPMSSLAPAGDEGPAVDPDRFRGAADAYPGHWWANPSDWTTLPEEALLGRETVALVQRTIETLPEAQRAVITMRDVAGCSSEEVCQALGVTEGNQRVLLHRARSRVRAVLEEHLDG